MTHLSSLSRMVFPHALLLLIASATAFFSSASAVLPAAELNALRRIGDVLGKRDWDFSKDPCGGDSNWSTSIIDDYYTNIVTCDCNITTDVCHVVSIQLKAQNLSGTLPLQLTELPFLKEIDLTRNYLNGTIPKEWSSLPLVNISLIGNRLTGPIPKEWGNIGTLANLTLEYNMLSGSIPPEFGDLSSIEKMSLTSNNLTGVLPGELAKMTTLTDFRISDNQFEGSVPDFIQNLTNLKTLMIQGSGLNGPIPSGVASLTKLTDLRISDLTGNDSSFPSVSGATLMKTLILRNCNITGQLPDYLGSMATWKTSLKYLDLSFNKLTGPIPTNFGNLVETDRILLTGNLLSGTVPDWMLTGADYVDLSYNNFTKPAIESNCQPRNTNLFASSSKGTASGIVSCLRNTSNLCPSSVYSLHINCGGAETKIDNGTVYLRDEESATASKFYRSSNWAFSSTGNFLDDRRPTDTYIPSSSIVSATVKDRDLYTNARISPISLTYYALCLGNGNYTVNLHFAEIMFTDDQTYYSLGRRIFDIFIQGKLVKKDFNIEEEAGGVGIPTVHPFTAVVEENTLEIRFFWAGKGTNGIPVRGVYGPLISAISIISDFPPPNSSSLSAGAIAGISLAVLFIISGVFAILWWKGCLPCKDSIANDLKGLELHTGIFTLRQIKAATNNFDAANKIGEGGFGPVYKGNMGDGNIIAVKQLSAKSKQGNREFVNEIGMISALQHPHLVKLHGCCIEGNQLLLVYEYMENNSLARALFGPEQHRLELDWPTRHKICIGIARGLAYLHEESRLKIVHRDIKATNVLLDKDLNPKISDFGLAKLDEEDNTHISTRIAGTFGYMAPEYAMRGYLTDKADVYSFGIVVLEIVSGRGNTSMKQKQDCFYLLDWANELMEEGKLRDLVDPRLLGSDKNEEEIMLTLHIGLLCANVSPTDRPSMSSVVSMLEGRGVDKKAISELMSGGSSRKGKFKAMEIEAGSQSQEVSMDVPFSAVSASSTSDLYPINIESDYLLRR